MHAYVLPKEKRLHPRVELLATVQIHDGDELLILPVVNISLGGAYLSGDGVDLSRLRIGAEREVEIFEASGRLDQIVVRARMVRKDGRGLAVTWIGIDDTFKIATLIDL